MLRPIRLALALVIVLAAFAPAAEARVARDFIGITAEDVFAGGSAYRASSVRQQRSLRIGMTRQTFDWASIERSPGSYSFGTYDNYVATLASQGMEVLPILFNPPGHQRRGGGRTCQPRSNAAMARFARAVARRYGPRGSLWRERPGVRKVPIRSYQIWNEPPLMGLYWCGSKRRAARRYVSMLKTVGRAIKRVDRRAEIVTAGLPPSKLRRAIRLTTFIRQMYRAGARRYFDTMAINSYARNSRELSRLLRSIRRLMNRYRDRRARIWVTEMGWGDRGPRNRFIVGARGQASRISSSLRYIRRARRRLRLRGFVYFSWRDGRPYPPFFKDLWGLHTGLLTVGGSRKRAYASFQRAARRF
jgi:hypothetical protein